MFLDDYKKFHFVGIGGIGVSAAAKMMKNLGRKVSGSDLGHSEITEDLEKRGIKVFYNHRAENIPLDTDILVYTSAAPKDNPEREDGRKLNIPEFSYFEFLGKLSQEYFTIAVSGTHGKSTTTAMIGLILEAAGLDPTVIVGSKVKTFSDGNLRLGKSKYLVIEACEHEANMKYLRPRMIVLTNIEEDHLDFYGNLQNIIRHFKEYVNLLPANGSLIVNADDANSVEIAGSWSGNKISFGLWEAASFKMEDIKIQEGKQIFNVLNQKIILQVPGKHNVYNALAALAAGRTLNIDFQTIQQSLAEFSGIWRRFERVGERNGAIIISDYAHHPTEIKATLQAAREFYPERRIMLVFQPHQRSRTKLLFKQFIPSFENADFLILSEIFSPQGRDKEEDKIAISSRQLAEAVTARDKIECRKREVVFAEDLEKARKTILEHIKPQDLVIVMGAGDIYKIAENLISQKNSK